MEGFNKNELLELDSISNFVIIYKNCRNLTISLMELHYFQSC